jgi:hypothetical protein
MMQILKVKIRACVDSRLGIRLRPSAGDKKHMRTSRTKMRHEIKCRTQLKLNLRFELKKWHFANVVLVNPRLDICVKYQYLFCGGQF